MDDLSQVLSQARIAQNLTCAELGLRCQPALSANRVRQLEDPGYWRVHSPSVVTLQRLASALGLRLIVQLVH